ncbi:hypothetical protein FIU87_02425 [Bacillus sp. THAF10]|uniref:hypothetical protein n=1 Tax=Bacillus sp. THAF10 TaxID=2587848 RepID=UPI0012A7DF86|nr:hypothetical protein [Bacillus sp. THAF10]QFT87495.1 hypothetical protein FIU87_02425 [Bacillus sp. THAF10]
MNTWLYSIYFFILAIVAFFTGEIVTLIMLGLILLCLNNIYNVLVKIYQKQCE